MNTIALLDNLDKCLAFNVKLPLSCQEHQHLCDEGPRVVCLALPRAHEDRHGQHRLCQGVPGDSRRSPEPRGGTWAEVRDSYEGDKETLTEACGSEEVADEILKALKMSMGQALRPWNSAPAPGHRRDGHEEHRAFRQ